MDSNIEIVKLKERINLNMHGYARSSKDAVGYAWKIGRDLTEARGTVEHGGWGAFLKSIEMPRSTAHKYISLFEGYDEMSMACTYESLTDALSALKPTVGEVLGDARRQADAARDQRRFERVRDQRVSEAWHACQDWYDRDRAFCKGVQAWVLGESAERSLSVDRLVSLEESTGDLYATACNEIDEIGRQLADVVFFLSDDRTPQESREALLGELVTVTKRMDTRRREACEVHGRYKEIGQWKAPSGESLSDPMFFPHMQIDDPSLSEMDCIKPVPIYGMPERLLLVFRFWLEGSRGKAE